MHTASFWWALALIPALISCTDAGEDDDDDGEDDDDDGDNGVTKLPDETDPGGACQLELLQPGSLPDTLDQGTTWEDSGAQLSIDAVGDSFWADLSDDCLWGGVLLEVDLTSLSCVATQASLTVSDGCPGCTEATAYSGGQAVATATSDTGWTLTAEGGIDKLEWWSYEAGICGISLE